MAHNLLLVFFLFMNSVKRYIIEVYYHYYYYYYHCYYYYLKICVCQGTTFFHEGFGKISFARSKSLIAPPPNHTVPQPHKSNGRPLRAFHSARFAHNVFIWVGLHSWSVLKAVVRMFVFVWTGKERPIERYKASPKVQKEYRTLSTFKKKAKDTAGVTSKPPSSV